MTATAKKPPIELHPHCLQCDYDLSHHETGRCPECGRPIGPADLTPSHIPWAHRKQIGRVRAYLLTLYMVLLHRRAIQAEFDRGVRYQHAQWFRWVTVAIAWLSLIATLVLLLSSNAAAPGRPPSALSGGTPVERIAIMLGGGSLAMLALAAWTGIPSYFFHPRSLSVDRQNRAIALSYYATAALALSPIGPFFLLLGLGLFGFTESVEAHYVAMVAMLIGALFPLVVMLLYLAEVVGLAVRLLPSGRRYGYLVGLIVPVLWLISGVLIFVGVPAFLALAFLVGLRFFQ